jgi:hypothetical protein
MLKLIGVIAFAGALGACDKCGGFKPLWSFAPAIGACSSDPPKN